MSEIRPFVIWFQHRSGSTHLVSLLNSHSQIHCKGEVFGCIPLDFVGNRIHPGIPNAKKFGERQYRRIINQFPGRQQDPSDQQCLQELNSFLFNSPNTEPSGIVRGFKYKFPSQANVFAEVTNKLVQRASEIKLIVLSRKDYLRRAISVMNLSRLQSATSKANSNGPVELPPADFDATEVVRLVKYYVSIESEFQAWATNFPKRFDLDYSDLSDSTVLTHLKHFLGVSDAETLTSKTYKVTPNDLRNHVTNIDEILAALRQERIDNTST